MEGDESSRVSVNLQHNSNSTLEQRFSSAETGSEFQKSLEDLLQNAYQHDEVVNSIIAAKE